MAEPDAAGASAPEGTDQRPSLDIALEKVCRIIVKARQFDAKEDVVEEDFGGNPADDGFREVLESFADDPVFDELRAFIDEMDVDERSNLVALLWLGRGDYELSEWDDAVALAVQERMEATARYLLGQPLLADHLADGLSQFGLSCADFERQHL
jgi:hypothetical protein